MSENESDIYYLNGIPCVIDYSLIEMEKDCPVEPYEFIGFVILDASEETKEEIRDSEHSEFFKIIE